MGFGVWGLDQVVDIATDGRHLSRDRGFLKVAEDGSEIGRIALDDVAAVIVHAHGTTWSNALLAELANRGAPVVICGRTHAPQSVLMPIQGHHAQGARIRAQWGASAPFQKQAWKRIVVAKIEMQAAALSAFGMPNAQLLMLSRKVRSGDVGNVEAQAARSYWPAMMGDNFRRRRESADANALLNYGYTVLRAATSRAVVASGLHPSIGVHHAHRGNAFALADDLMEPFRPLVDCAVRNLVKHHGTDVDKNAKRVLAALIALDLPLGGANSPVTVALAKLSTSLGQSFETGNLSLALPSAPNPSTLAGLGR